MKYLIFLTFVFCLIFPGVTGIALASENQDAHDSPQAVGPSGEAAKVMDELQSGQPSSNSSNAPVKSKAEAPKQESAAPSASDATDYDPGVSQKSSVEKKDKALPGGYVKMSGRYRLAAGANGEDFILNNANADLQERNFRYIFGERLNDTYDPALYSQYLLNIDFSPQDKFNFYTQMVADPWSWVGQTGEQVQKSDIGTEVIRYNLKYFGAFNSVLNEIWRTNVADSYAFPIIKVHNDQTTPTVVHGFFDFNPGTGGVPITIPALDIDYEFRPIRKLWMDYTEDQWHARIFALADQSQALTTDDPLELSNHKDYWQQSPWLYQYKPVQFFSDRSIKRGFYDDALSFLARDSEGNRLVLLRGASFEGDFGKTYLAASVAAPFTPWDEKFFAADNVPGAVRLKHQVNDKLLVGGTYTFRTGLVDNSVADFNQVGAVDGKYQINKAMDIKGEIAASHRDQDLLTDSHLKTNSEGYAYKAALDANFDHRMDGHTDFLFSFTQMDKDFDPNLSRYTNTRDDHFWGKHITFKEFSPNLEHFRIGDGIDRNRFVIHAQWREKLFKDRFENLFDVRNVHKSENTAYKETVLRNETTYRFTSRLTGKALFRWQGLPKTTQNIEPFIDNFYFNGNLVSLSDPLVGLQNVAIPADRDPSRFTYAGALQYLFNKEWTAEGFVEVSKDLSSFPRALLNDTFRDRVDNVEGILTDRLVIFLYGQGPFGGVPPYEYHTTVKERLIYKPDERITIILHAAQNGYKFASGIDDNINHQGVSVSFDYSKKVNFFIDYTHSLLIDVPRLIATNFTVSDFADHHNFYVSAEYKINTSQVFRAEYGVIGFGLDTPYQPLVTPYSAVAFSLPTIDTEHLFRVSLTGDF